MMKSKVIVDDDGGSVSTQEGARECHGAKLNGALDSFKETGSIFWGHLRVVPLLSCPQFPKGHMT